MPAPPAVDKKSDAKLNFCAFRHFGVRLNSTRTIHCRVNFQLRCSQSNTVIRYKLQTTSPASHLVASSSQTPKDGSRFQLFFSSYSIKLVPSCSPPSFPAPAAFPVSLPLSLLSPHFQTCGGMRAQPSLCAPPRATRTNGSAHTFQDCNPLLLFLPLTVFPQYSSDTRGIF